MKKEQNYDLAVLDYIEKEYQINILWVKTIGKTQTHYITWSFIHSHIKKEQSYTD